MELPPLPFVPQRIFIAPLNWGLGHATRTADLIMQIKKRYPDATVRLGSDGVAANWLRQRFPELGIMELPGYRIRYPKGKALVARLLWSAPFIAYRIFRERLALHKELRKHPADLVISDNRYGIRHPKCYNVFVTHQLEVQPPQGKKYTMLFRMLNHLHNRYISRFDQCWVPDFSDPPGLAGGLSHPARVPFNVRYIGPLSRFRWVIPPPQSQEPVDLLCLVSGPEPQRSMFFNLLIDQLEMMKVSAVLLSGTPGEAARDLCMNHVTIHSDLSDEALMELIRRAKLIVSRPGYSTLMDHYVTGGKALFVPTPGQTEQEYLAKRLEGADWALVQTQDQINLEMALEWSRNALSLEPLDVSTAIS